MCESEIKLSESQIGKMKHAIGFCINRVKKGIYTAFRNHYVCGDDAEWNELVALGFAKKRIDPFCKTDVIYYVTQVGLDYLSRLIGVNIKKINNMAHRKIVHIDELCQECGYFANNEPDTHNGHNYGCNHPDNTDGDLQCMASACPLGCLAEAYHFEEILGMSHDEALQWDNESSCVVIDDVEIEIELQH